MTHNEQKKPQKKPQHVNQVVMSKTHITWLSELGISCTINKATDIWEHCSGSTSPTLHEAFVDMEKKNQEHHDKTFVVKVPQEGAM